MSIKDKLAIYLITYNRKWYLQKTFEQIFSQNSPIKDFEITILDNASTDGSSELIDEYCNKFSNITHIRHNLNIGGNANIVRAYEMGASSGKDYVWVLCDDDKYDFSNWSEVEQLINSDIDAICLSDYAFKTEESKNLDSYKILQMTFVPACIFKTSNITDTVLTNMYDAIYTMFSQSCITINLINKRKKIEVLSKPIVFNGVHFEDRCTSTSYTRGSINSDVLPRRQEQNWIIGYANIISLLKNKTLQQECLEKAILCKEIYPNKIVFYNDLICFYINKTLRKYFYEIFNILHKDKNIFLSILIIVISLIDSLIKNLFYSIKRIINFYQIINKI